MPDSSSAVAITLPAIFSDHMVLQRAARVPVWGRAAGVGEVSVALAGRAATCRVKPDGKWMAWLDLVGLGPGPFAMTVEANGFQRVISDVVVGEVWLASGQSNVQMILQNTIGADAEMARPANPLLRQFAVRAGDSRVPLEDCEGAWVAAGPETVGSFSGTGYHFARRLQEDLGVPVGILHSSRGATPCEGWISRQSLGLVPELAQGCERLESLSGGPAVERPPSYTMGGSLFNAMIHPICPYGLRGVIWYQGESNVERAWQYRVTFPLLIADWRAWWQQGDFPFYFCQLANHLSKVAVPGESIWAELREAQAKTLAVANTAQAVLIDLGEADDIHPRNKREVGERLARIALAREYGRTRTWSGPVFRSISIEKGGIRLGFDHVDDGLVARPLSETHSLRTSTGETAPLVRNSPESELEGFAICGMDRQWVWADAKIEGDTVLVWSPEIAAPVAVRYAWADNPSCNLGNGAGLQASPFRTDDFPALTRKVRYGFVGTR